MDVAALHQQVVGWLDQSRKRILAAMAAPLTVATKSNRNDLVTNVDRANQAFLVAQLQAAYPQAAIVGEESHLARPQTLAGLVFFLDPIDGTMNFVKQRANFAVMLGAYVDGVAVYGAILDVMADRLITGGPAWPVAVNGVPQPAPRDLPLAAGLLGVNSRMAIHNQSHLGELALASAGARMIGSAGMTFAAITMGQQVGYVSYLQPWDVAAGAAIGAGFGLRVTRPDGAALDLLQPGLVVAAMPQAHAAIVAAMARP
ncbi:inositol monophosphatase family protein [Lacticaseibacillus parakribbianus]|uniref:inositol monophosphatase family protein n=1 Tax=Lacticaseibacillus parakribbianus TaxID=2970927 RepID=UPI0021CB6FC5|nr:inositol monophosphatase family protein [Lacticaseibacillus parakribbianus]